MIIKTLDIATLINSPFLYNFSQILCHRGTQILLRNIYHSPAHIGMSLSIVGPLYISSRPLLQYSNKLPYFYAISHKYHSIDWHQFCWETFIIIWLTKECPFLMLDHYKFHQGHFCNILIYYPISIQFHINITSKRDTDSVEKHLSLIDSHRNVPFWC